MFQLLDASASANEGNFMASFTPLNLAAGNFTPFDHGEVHVVLALSSADSKGDNLLWRLMPMLEVARTHEQFGGHWLFPESEDTRRYRTVNYGWKMFPMY